LKKKAEPGFLGRRVLGPTAPDGFVVPGRIEVGAVKDYAQKHFFKAQLAAGMHMTVERTGLANVFKVTTSWPSNPLASKKQYRMVNTNGKWKLTHYLNEKVI